MEMYLRHYFDPNFDYQSLRPAPAGQGDTDCYNLGYVQNVIKGQILAELVPLAEVEEPLPRFILKEAVLPQGANTRIDPDHPQYLLADANGYVFYYQDKIVVKRLLNVRTDVSFQTGNIFFVGDTVVHKDVKAGFSVQANNVLVHGIVEGGEVRARKDLKVEGGARGGAGNRCLLDSSGSLRVTFAEKIEMRSRGKLLVDNFSAHSSIYVAGDLIIEGMLLGGTCHAARHILVKGNAGNRTGAPTGVHLGYDPHLMRRKEQFEKRLGVLTERISHYEAVVGHLPPDANELTRKLEAARKKRQMLFSLQEALSQTMYQEEAAASGCRFIVMGTVFPGVEITIGRAVYKVSTPQEGVYFRLENDEIVSGPIPDKLSASVKR